MSSIPSILVVDYDKDHREVLAQMLESRGYFVVQSENAEDALKLLGTQSFYLIFMDAIQPGINGFQATRLVKSQPKFADLPIVISKSTVYPTDKRWASDQGAIGTLSKPYKRSEVLEFTKELDTIKFKDELDEKLPVKIVNFTSKTKI